MPRADAESAVWAGYLAAHSFPPFELLPPRKRGRAIELGTSIVELLPDDPVQVARMEITHRVPQEARDDWDTRLARINENLPDLRRRRR